MSIRQLNHLKYLWCPIDTLSTSPSSTLQLTSLVPLEFHLDGFEFRDVDCPIEKLQFFQHLSCLEVLVVQNNYFNPVKFISLYQRAFELCPSLKHVDARYKEDAFYDRFFPPENGIFVSNMHIHERDILGWRREYGIGVPFASP
ncbi:hypothetical protein D9619_012666 [Psilocybe cf. subviscida]|uniref:Uncharacterized protein n=1 Tax=Psilocybe cf. subviscida TaxID=2480587 RepID=A0A8H5B6U1_9AGAR|nr:hypothetical protein D9619_012666 [Psilocybe cf. subviscida]